MSEFSNIIRPANAIPRWPFTINRQSEQARGLVFWMPVTDGLGQRDFIANAGISRSGGTFGWWPDDTHPIISAAVNTTIQATLDLSAYSSVTVCGWYYLRSVAAYNMLFEYGPDGATTAGGFACYTEGDVRINANGWGGVLLVAASAPLRMHFAVVLDRNVEIRGYQNGTSWFNGGTPPGGTFSNQTLNILNRNGGSLQADADLKDFRVYSRALSATEVWALYDPATRYELYQPLSRRVYGIPAASADQTAILPLLEAANNLYAPTVVPAALTLTLPRIEATESIYSPTVSAGAVTAVLPAISADGAAYAPTVAPGTVTETLPLIGAAGELYAPTVVEAGTTAVLPQLAANGAFYSPTIIFDQTMTLPQLAAGGALYAPTVALNLAAGIRVTISNAPVLNLTLADASVLTLTASDDLAEG